MTEHAPVTTSRGWTHCRHCLETWPCHWMQAEQATRGRLATAISTLGAVLCVLLLIALALTP